MRSMGGTCKYVVPFGLPFLTRMRLRGCGAPVQDNSFRNNDVMYRR